MLIAARSRAEILADAQQQYRDAIGQAPPVEHRNVQPVQDLDALLRFEFRGVLFKAEPTPFADGAWLTYAQSRVGALANREDEAALNEYVDLCAQAVERFGRMARPVRWRDRIRYRKRNPFAGASDAEMGWLVGFFWSRRMIALVRQAPRN